MLPLLHLFADVLSALIAEETCLCSLSSPHSILAASQKTNTVKGSSSEHCEHCKKTSHCSKNCFARYPEKLADYRALCAARGRAAGSPSEGPVDKEHAWHGNLKRTEINV